MLIWAVQVSTAQEVYLKGFDMVERTQVDFQLPSGGNVAPAFIQPATAQPDRPVGLENSLLRDALTGVMDLGQKLLARSAQEEAQLKYLEGARARQLGESIDSVDSDFLSKRFVRGGWNDQDFRIAQSEMMTNAQQFIATNGRALSPEQFQEYLRNEGNKVISKLGPGMSPEMRAKALAAHTDAEATLSAMHSKAHRAYSLEQVGKRITTQGNEITRTLVVAQEQDDPATTTHAFKRAAQFYYDIAATDTLPEEMRNEVGYQYLTSLLAADQHHVVSALLDNGALDNLPFDQRTKLAGSLREAEGRARTVEALGTYETTGRFMELVADGKARIEDVRSFVENRVRNGLMTPKEAQRLYQTYYKSASDSESTLNLMDALNRGDLNRINSLGFTVQEAIDRVDLHMAKAGVGAAERTQKLLTMGAQVGHIPKQVGQQIAAAVNSVASQEDVNPEQANLLVFATSEVARLSASKPSTLAVFLNGLPKETRAIMTSVMQGTQSGKDPVASIRDAVAKTEEYAALSEFQRKGISSKFRTKISETVREPGMWHSIKSFFAGDSRFNSGASLSDNPGQLFALEDAVMQEVHAMAGDRQYMALFGDLDNEDAQEAVLADATARAYSRAIMVSEDDGGTGSLLMLPRNTSARQLFGVSDHKRIGAVINEMYPAEHEDYTAVYRVVQGVTPRYERLQYDERGVLVKATPMDINGIREKLQAQQDAILGEQTKARFGESLSVDDAGTARNITLDGTNNHGIESTAVLAWRRDLLDSEGYRTKVYKDSLGKLTVGIGHLVTPDMNLKEGDTITEEQVHKLFLQDTDKAMRLGKSAANALSVSDPKAVLALSEAIYQLGPAGWGAFKKAQQAIVDKDYAQFVIEVQDSDWHRQTPKRTTKFVQNMAGHFGIK